MAIKFSWIMLLMVVKFHFPQLAVRADFIQEKKELAAFEKEMAERPLEAVGIARRASALLAVKEQEKHLPELSLAQAIELADVSEKKLLNPAMANHIRQTWLAAHGFGLSPEDVRRLVGLPQRISFQVLYGRQVEQWTYERPNQLWLTFTCTKDHTPVLQNVRSSSAKQ